MFKTGTSCIWHQENTDNPDSCTSATCCRLVYTILDLCCQHYGVKLVGGRHVPVDVDTRAVDELYVEEEWEDWDE